MRAKTFSTLAVTLLFTAGLALPSMVFSEAAEEKAGEEKAQKVEEKKAEVAIEKLQQDVEWRKALTVCVPLAACPPVRPDSTGSKLPVAPENPHLGVFSL